MSLERWRGRSFKSVMLYGIIGLTSNLVGYAAYLALTHWGSDPKLAMSLLYAIACSIGFFGNRRWTFAHQGGVLGSALRFLAAHLMGYLMNLSILIVFVDRLGYPHQAVQAVAIFVVAAFLYVAFRWFVFPRKIVGRAGTS
jgi:putative flippase GtrA